MKYQSHSRNLKKWILASQLCLPTANIWAATRLRCDSHHIKPSSMLIPVRWCVICIRRYLTLSIILIVCFTSALSILLYKWTELDVKLDCLTKQNAEPLTTTLGSPVLSKTMDIKLQQFTARDLISQKFANKSELRLKWLRQKVEKISQKVRRSQPVKLVEQEGSITHPNYNVHIFYYAWYGNVTVDGQWKHWNHEYLPNWKKEDRKIYPTGMHEPPGDISSNFYPLLGCYSSRDPTVIDNHMRQLRNTKVGMYLENTV